MTTSQLTKFAREFAKHAQEPGKVEPTKGAVLFFGSELATLRLLKAYRESKHARQGYSDNLGSFYFSLETPFLAQEDEPETPHVFVSLGGAVYTAEEGR